MSVDALSTALRALERHVAVHAFDEQIIDLDGGIVGGSKSSRLMLLLERAQEALHTHSSSPIGWLVTMFDGSCHFTRDPNTRDGMEKIGATLTPLY